MTIDDLIFTARDAQSYTELKWNLFTGYKIYEYYLFLVLENNLLSSYTIYKNELLPQNFEELCRFVSSKMPEWK